MTSAKVVAHQQLSELLPPTQPVILYELLILLFTDRPLLFLEGGGGGGGDKNYSRKTIFLCCCLCKQFESKVYVPNLIFRATLFGSAMYN